MYQVKGPTWKWKMEPIGKNEADSGVQRLQEGGIVDADGSNLTLEGIVCLEIVGVNICLIRCSPDGTCIDERAPRPEPTAIPAQPYYTVRWDYTVRSGP